jgi:HEXXH motif-containing protein
VKTHTVPAEDFDRLARGDGDTQGVLRSGQRSKRLLLLCELVAEARARAPRLCAEAGMDEAFAVLVDAQRRQPHVVDDLLLQPHVGAWVTHCIRTLATTGDLDPADLGHLGTVAAAAAVRAGLPFAVNAHQHDDGSLMFPTFGLARPVSGPRLGWCRIRSRAGPGIEIATATTTTSIDLSSPTDTPVWQPLRRLRSTAHGLTIDVHLDDIDPYRGSDDVPATDRADAQELAIWQRRLDAVWEWLADQDQDRAMAIASGTSALVPMRQMGTVQRSATRHDAPGAIALTQRPSVRSALQALVHEYQHTKLCMLLDLVPLIETTPQVRSYYSPWRDDPRPLRGLLHGGYAYLGLAALVDRESRERDGKHPAVNPRMAQFELAMWREQVGHVVGTLRRSDVLTLAGHQFEAVMRKRLSDLRRTLVPPKAQVLARAACLDHETSWRLRNIIPDPAFVDECGTAWLAGKLPPTDHSVEPRLTNGELPMPSDARLSLIRRQFGRRDEPPDGHAEPSTGDERFIRGDLSGAADAYRSRILREPSDAPAWAGLALVCRYLIDGTSAALANSPELVRAVHVRVRERNGKAPEPGHLAAWLAASTTN